MDEIDSSIDLFVGTLGMTLIERKPSPDFAGELAIIDAGSIFVTLIQPHTTGPGYVLPQREPRLSQLVVAPTDGENLVSMRQRCAHTGTATADLAGDGFYVTPECVEGALGIKTAVVVTGVTAGDE